MHGNGDTQSIYPGEGELRKHSRRRQRPQAPKRSRRLLLTIILTTAVTLAFTLVLFVRALPPRGAANLGGIQLSIDQAGRLRSLSTRLETVGELLKQQGLDEPDYAALSHSRADPLEDGMVIHVSRARNATIRVNGDERQFKTALENPAAILHSAGIPVNADDKIWVNGALADFAALPAWTLPARHIRIRRAARLTLIDDGIQSTIATNADTIGDALYEADIALYLTDQVSPALETAPVDGMTIRIKRALPVTLLVDGVTIDARTNAALVGEALIELNAPLFGLDFVRPSAETPVRADMTIEIVRVLEDVLIESAAIDFKTVTQLDDSLNLDEVAVLQEGRAGAQESRYRVRYENGVEAARELIETIIAEAPTDKIVAYGSRIARQIVDTPAGPRNYWRRLCVYATSYKPESNGGNTRTATGATLAKGIIAAKPRIIPYHTQVYVPNYGIGVVRDTGAGPSSTPYWIDLGYSDHDWITWGGYTWVYLLGPPPGDVNYDLPAWRPVRNRAGGCG